MAELLNAVIQPAENGLLHKCAVPDLQREQQRPDRAVLPIRLFLRTILDRVQSDANLRTLLKPPLHRPRFPKLPGPPMGLRVLRSRVHTDLPGLFHQPELHHIRGLRSVHHFLLRGPSAVLLRTP